MTATGDLRALLERHATRTPAAVALHGGDRDPQTRMTWWGLRDAVTTAAVGARRAAADGPSIVVMDGTGDSVVAALGCLLAGVSVALVEPKDRGLAAGHPALRPVLGLAGLTSAARDRAPAAQPADRTGDPELLLVTSGSTGEPRMTRQRLRDFLLCGALHRRLYGLSPSDTVLTTVPLAHSFGLMVGLAGALTAGAGLITLTRPRPAMLVDLIARADVLLAAPFVYGLLALRPVTATGPERGLRLALSAGAPLPAETAERAAAVLGCPVFQNYGSAETGPITSQFHRAAPWPADTVGVAVPGVEWRIQPVDGAGDAADHDRGRLLVRTTTLFRGYLGAPPSDVDRDGFYDTGDLVRVDAEGHFFLEGRVSTFINVAGRKVNPRWVERAGEEHPGVREVAVYGVAGQEWGEEVHAAVVLAAGATVDDLVAHWRSRLSAHEVPHHVHVLTRLPRNPRGKVDRAGLPVGSA